MDFNSITKKINDSLPLDFGLIFNNSFELFKQVWVQGFVTLLLTMLSILPFYLLIYIPAIFMGVIDPEMMEQEGPSPIFIIFIIIIYPIMILVISTVSIALNASFLRVCKLKDNQEMGAEDYFYYLKGKYLKKTFMLGLITFGLSVLGLLTFGLGIFYLMVPIALFPAFLAFNEELEPMEIVKASFQLGNKNWLVIFGLLLVMGLIAQLGFILCCIGVLFTAALARIPVYYIYKDAIGFSKEQLHNGA